MSGGLHSLATIIKRLEAATSRIEDLANIQGFPAVAKAEDLKDEPSPTSYGSAPPPPPPPPPPSLPPATPETPRSIVVFDETIIEGKLKPFLELTRSFAGASVIEIVALVEKEFTDLRKFLHMAAICQKPEQKVAETLLAPLQADIEAITRSKEANRKDRDWFTHLTTIAEGSPCVGWVVSPTPGPYVNDIKESALYYGNRVIKEYKDKNSKHAEWVRSYIALLEETRKYTTEYHKTGLVWNSKGVPVAQYSASQSNARISSGGAPQPPPPPPPPPPPAPSATVSSGSSGGGAAAVFAELNRGEEVTKGLRKVDKSEMTHKNPALRAGGVVSSSSGLATTPKKPVKPTKPQSLMGKKPSKFALEGNKWVIEYQENESALIVENGERNQTVNLFGCKNSNVQIKGKINAVVLVNCVKTSVLVDSVISSISVTNSPSFAVQITGSAPTIQVDSTDSGQIYLSRDCLGAEITTAKCSSINVSLPVEGEEQGVFEEAAVPEMLKTIVKDGKLVTTVVEHVG